MLGNNSACSLFTEQSTSPTFLEPRATIVFGSCSIWPLHVRLGKASQVTWTGCPSFSEPISGSSTNTRTRIRVRSANSASTSPVCTNVPARAGSEYSVPPAGAVTCADFNFSSSDCIELRASSIRKAARSACGLERCCIALLFSSISLLSASAFSSAVFVCSTSWRVAACLAYSRSRESRSRRRRSISVLVLAKSPSSCAISSGDPPPAAILRSSSAATSCSLACARSLRRSLASSVIKTWPRLTV